MVNDIQLQGTRVLVTGAGGFIGSHLAEALVQRGANVRAMVRYCSDGRRGWLEHSPHADAMEFHAGDIRDAAYVRHVIRDVEVVFHLAALIAIPYSYMAPASYVETNITGTLNVLQAARDLGTARIVHTSTSEVYGTARSVPITEEHPLQGQSPYSASKIGADKIAESFWLSFRTPVVTLRPFNTFGPRQSTRAVIPTIITQLLRRQPVRLGNLAPTRDFNFVDNTVEAFIAAGTRAGALGHTINAGSGGEISIGALAEKLRALTSCNVPIESEAQRLRPEGSEVDRLLACNKLAARVLQWEPRVSLEEGLKRTIAWMEQNLDAYRVGQYHV